MQLQVDGFYHIETKKLIKKVTKPLPGSLLYPNSTIRFILKYGGPKLIKGSCRAMVYHCNIFLYKKRRGVLSNVFLKTQTYLCSKRVAYEKKGPKIF